MDAAEKERHGRWLAKQHELEKASKEELLHEPGPPGKGKSSWKLSSRATEKRLRNIARHMDQKKRETRPKAPPIMVFQLQKGAFFQSLKRDCRHQPKKWGGKHDYLWADKGLKSEMKA